MLRPKWFTRTVRRALSTRNKLYRDSTRLPSGPRCPCFLLTRSRTKSFKSQTKVMFELNICSHIIDNKTFFNAFVRLKVKNRNGALLMCSDQVHIAFFILHLANVFAAYIAKAFHPDDHLPNSCLPTPTTAMKNVHITPKAAAAILIQLNPHKSTGSDGLHPSLICIISLLSQRHLWTCSSISWTQLTYAEGFTRFNLFI